MQVSKSLDRPSFRCSLKWLVLITILTTVFASQAGSNYDMRKTVIASGGQVTGGPYVLNGAIGQGVSQVSASSTYQVSAGFYQENRDLIFYNEFE